MEWIIFALIWTAFGVINFGAEMANFSSQFSYLQNGGCALRGDSPDEAVTYREHLGAAIPMALGGPLAFIISLSATNFYQRGFAWTPAGVRKVLDASKERKGWL